MKAFSPSYDKALCIYVTQQVTLTFANSAAFWQLVQWQLWRPLLEVTT